MKKICKYCLKTGKLKGAGHVDVECHQCNGTGYDLDDDLDLFINENKSTYNESIDKIKSLGASDEKAKELFKEEYKRQGRPRKKA